MEHSDKMVHYPDKWIIVKIKDRKSNEVIYKLLCGFNGSYTTGQSWVLNRGIDKVRPLKDGKHFIVNPMTSSIYHIFPGHYGLNMTSAGVLDRLKKSEMYEVTQVTYEDSLKFLKDKGNEV